MTKEEILKEIDDEIAITKDWLENVMNDITATEHIKRYAKAECNSEIKTLEWVKEMLEK